MDGGAPEQRTHSLSSRLDHCAAVLRKEVQHHRRDDQETETAAARLLSENYSFLQDQILVVRHAVAPVHLRKLMRAEESKAQHEPRVYTLAKDFVAQSSGTIDAAAVTSYGEILKTEHALDFAELWAFGSMLRLAILEQLSANLLVEPMVSTSIKSLRALETVPWREFVEENSAAEQTLRRDPAGIYAQMDFATRDLYRRKIEGFARSSQTSEAAVAAKAIGFAEAAKAVDAGSVEAHVGYYLIGPGVRRMSKSRWADWVPYLHVGSFVILAALLWFGFERLAGDFPRWLAVFAIIPITQVTLEIINSVISRVVTPQALPSMDFSEGIPDSAKTMVVVPTLLVSAKNVAKLLEDLEIRFLANRDPNLFFALLTDFPDADRQELATDDAVLDACRQGIQRLNTRYGGQHNGPFYLFHRARFWNPQEGVWMGEERKRGKLNDLNRLLLGRGNAFHTVVGALPQLTGTRYVITLDTDTQLPRDTAAKMIGVMAHPLNRPVLDERTGVVVSGYSLLRPRVSVSMESAGQSRLAQMLSGQSGFDPYAISVSDVYQDLYGRASFSGKGIYDIAAFDAAVGERFPENAILSHDLIEGEHARTGFLASVEVVEDCPATYRAFCKRKHRWARGDWQLLPWLVNSESSSRGPSGTNPLSLLSRWKIFDNLLRSFFEISTLLLFVVGWITFDHTARWTFAVLALLLSPIYVDVLLSLIRSPERRFWPSFSLHLGGQFLRRHRDALVNLAFLAHQALLMADAIVRTLVRRFITKRKLLEWETMWQSQHVAGQSVRGMEHLYISSAAAVILLFGVLGPVHAVVALVCSLWIVAPLIALWISERPGKPADLTESDRAFLRGVALRTWRFFTDYTNAENNWLIPDNMQQGPLLVAERISPTNLGLFLTAHLAAHDFGYVNLTEFSSGLGRAFDTMEKMPGYRGHFFNWYHTTTLEPLQPRYVSSVDSGNLAASFCALRQAALAMSRQPIISSSILGGLRDHVLRMRESIPYTGRSLTTMRLIGNILRHLDCDPTDLFFWENLLTDVRELAQRLGEVRGGRSRRGEDAPYWEKLLCERANAAIDELCRLAPWLAPPFEPELRVNLRDETLAPLMAELAPVPVLEALPELYDRIEWRLEERLQGAQPLYPELRRVLEELRRSLPAARAHAATLIHSLKRIAADSGRYFDAMDFGFLFNTTRELLVIGYNVDAGRPDEACYDLLASEARTAVFVAIAKGDIPREAWFRLGRRLTGYRNQRTLLSWSGTMFEYLMPLLHLHTYNDTLLERAAKGAVRIQEIYASERNIPWGISEAAYSARDSLMQYQYHAFGVPVISARADGPKTPVVAPYASMLALMVDPRDATANLRLLDKMGCMSRHGFLDSIDFAPASKTFPEPVRCWMAHHQGMGLLAIDNALHEGIMQDRFHQDPRVQATAFLLEERMPAIVETLSDPEPAVA
jgi:hypothetical protein